MTMDDNENRMYNLEDSHQVVAQAKEELAAQDSGTPAALTGSTGPAAKARQAEPPAQAPSQRKKI